MKTWPGKVATVLWTLAAGLWAYWGAAEYFFEAYGVPDSPGWAYLVPAAALWLLGLVALAWPRAGGTLLTLAGLAFTLWWWGLMIARGLFGWEQALATAPVSLALVLVGLLWWLEGRARGPRSRSRFLPLALPPAVVLGAALFYLPYVSGRTPASPGPWRVTTAAGELEWAPAGPGWNLRLGPRFPSWAELAAYGREPRGLGEKPGPYDPAAEGLCAYLDASGTRLQGEPAHVWRLPTRAEVVASLVRGGALAGCRYPGGERAACERIPNKEGPLWDPAAPAVYYWTAETTAEGDEAWYVPYSGGLRYGGRIASQPLTWGNPRHGYRCVRRLR
ncbi:hypothetical protein [Oceanithermus sp.]|uniref:hypothetical protein n=1 Tax=Oceanithermus sp. TaxID=2268145 RepID=UPI00257F64D6|nr:hypothetical protein [Oceanithermus sp.]